jgi:SAM-dependent methyltransferase
MPVYKRFAIVYAQGDYPSYSQQMSEYLPNILEHFHIPTRGTLLDVACGEGSFAVQMASKGWKVTGIDFSSEMLEIARQYAEEAGLKIKFTRQDMRRIKVAGPFDLATCWFDALNYVLEADELTQVFSGINSALKPGGWFAFDMNTVYGLAVGWQRQNCYIPQDKENLVEIQRPSYDFERQIATMHITAFIREPGGPWERMDEDHLERAFSLDVIQNCLKKAGFDVKGCFGSIRELTPPRTDSGRVWYVAQKHMA